MACALSKAGESTPYGKLPSILQLVLPTPIPPDLQDFTTVNAVCSTYTGRSPVWHACVVPDSSFLYSPDTQWQQRPHLLASLSASRWSTRQAVHLVHVNSAEQQVECKTHPTIPVTGEGPRKHASPRPTGIGL